MKNGAGNKLFPKLAEDRLVGAIEQVRVHGTVEVVGCNMLLFVSWWYIYAVAYARGGRGVGGQNLSH